MRGGRLVQCECMLHHVTAQRARLGVGVARSCRRRWQPRAYVRKAGRLAEWTGGLNEAPERFARYGAE